MCLSKMIAELNEELQDQIPAEACFSEKKVSIGGNRKYRFIKRVFDVAVSLIGGLILLIPMLLIGVMIRIDSPGPVIFKQKRMGKNGQIFTIYKFRTMYEDSPDNLSTNQFDDAHKYVTKVGSVLRRTSIDELPQLINVLRGEMSIVGYRPVCITETELNEKRKQNGVFALRPGITGLAQVSGRDNIVDYHTKVQLDTEYVRNCSLKLDLWCILKTFKVVFSGEGAK